MKSHEILDRVFSGGITRKEAARRLRLSQNLIDRWCISGDSGALNPLDRAQDIMRICAEQESLELAQLILDFICKPLVGHQVRLDRRQK